MTDVRDMMMRCPETDQPVWTRNWTTQADIDQGVVSGVLVGCPECGGEHPYTSADLFLGEMKSNP